MFAIPRAHLVDPAPTLLLRDRSGAFLGEVGAPEADGYGYWPTALGAGGEAPDEAPGGVAGGEPPRPQTNPRVVAATLALEDRRFHQHPGVDPVAVARAVRQNLQAGRALSGASTLAMQVARMQDPGPRTLPRKVVEAVTAVLLTARYGREAILEQYLRLAPYGNNIHGIAYAARRYLDKPVDDLSWAETAFLCALPQAPSRTNPFDPAGRARAVARARRILDVLHGQGLLDDAELALARDQLAVLRVPDKGRRPDEALHVVLRLGETLVDRSDPLVETTIDLPTQRAVTARLGEALARFGEKGARNGAVMVVDVATGDVRAAVGSSAYDDVGRAGAIDYTRAPRSPGSTLKPFFYAMALDRGVIGPGTVLDDLARGPDGIENVDGDALGPLLPRQALANSRNVPAVNLLAKVGLAEGYGILRELGLHSDELPASHYGLGLSIGGLPVRLDALTEAYTALAGDGRLRPLRWRADVAAAPGRRVFTESTARLLAVWLSDPMARLPTFPRMGPTELPFPVAAKTGTSSDYRDAWTVAWSTAHVVAVWIGDPTATPMARLGGYAAAAHVAREVLRDLHGDAGLGLSDTGFPPPAGWVGARVCPLSGRLGGEACGRVVTEHFPKGEAPTAPCDVHLRLRMDIRDGTLATADTPARYTRLETFVELPQRFAAWQARVGLPRPPSGRSMPGISLTPEAPRVRITGPRDGSHVARDPESPASTVALTATVEPPVPQLLWLVDGEPFALADAPYTVRWPVTPGEHHFEARIPLTPVSSAPVRLTAR
jgi:penicillin-binding protein 1C